MLIFRTIGIAVCAVSSCDSKASQEAKVLPKYGVRVGHLKFQITGYLAIC